MLLDEITWSPVFNKDAKVEYTAAMPDAKAKPLSAPSILHTLSINSEELGLEYLE